MRVNLENIDGACAKGRQKARIGDGSVANYMQRVHDGITHIYTSDPPSDVDEMNTGVECMVAFLK